MEEWKDGKYYPCENFEPVKSMSICCNGCGEDIEKPEQEVIIKKSSETWVARYDRVDYLLLNPQCLDIPQFMSTSFFKDCLSGKKHFFWKQISEIEITDEIAKLRPLIINDNGYSTILFGVLDGGEIVISDGTFQQDGFRLATVDDIS